MKKLMCIQGLFAYMLIFNNALQNYTHNDKL
jgi:hypothetical protein